MRIRTAIATALLFSTPIAAQAQQQQPPAPTLFSIIAGETMLLRLIGIVTPACDNTFISFESFDILQGPPEITLSYEPNHPVQLTVASGRMCPETPGGHLMITASKEIHEVKEANLDVRIRFKSRVFRGICG